jgi:hypothetical protein
LLSGPNFSVKKRQNAKTALPNAFKEYLLGFGPGKLRETQIALLQKTFE